MELASKHIRNSCKISIIFFRKSKCRVKWHALKKKALLRFPKTYIKGG